MGNSRHETWRHIREVRQAIRVVTDELERRGIVHDMSKLLPPEVEIFDAATPFPKDLTYGSEEYKAQLAKIKPAIEHHYSQNSHHPEHFPNGVAGMSLFDVVEMFCDWMASSKRHADGNMRDSLAINQKRFGFSDELASIFSNTLDEVEDLLKERKEKEID